MNIQLTIAAVVMLAGCAVDAPPPATDAPQRIVSLDYCADQYVLKFSDRRQILALSPDAKKKFSYLRARASDLRTVRPRAADILALQPDLVVRSYGGGPQIAAFLERAGVPVVQLGYPSSLAEVRDEVLRLSTALGDAAAGRAVGDDMDTRLASLRSGGTSRTALYMTPTGVTTGPDTLVGQMIEAAGLQNFQRRKGWNPVPLERLAYDRPDIVAAAFFEGESGHIDNWSAARHPVVNDMLDETTVVPISGAWTSCGGWFLIDAIEHLAEAPA